MINKQSLLAFLQFLCSRPVLKTTVILVLLFLLFLPGRNYYYSLTNPISGPVVRPLNFPVLPPSSYPVNPTQTSPPPLTSRSVIVVDVNSKAILFKKNPDQKLFPASTTKIMTALIALENYPLDQVVTVNYVNGEGQQMDLELGERITVENLLYGLLVQSGNDAAVVLAQNYPGGEPAFVQAMNQKAQDLSLLETHFTNPSGLDDRNHYTTVHDLALLTAEAMQNQTFAKMVSTIKITITDVDHTISHELEAVNELLGQVPGLAGVKTGWTELAGECLVSYVKRDNHPVIIALLGSQDRFAETQVLIDWVFKYHYWEEAPGAIHY